MDGAEETAWGHVGPVEEQRGRTLTGNSNRLPAKQSQAEHGAE